MSKRRRRRPPKLVIAPDAGKAEMPTSIGVSRSAEHWFLDAAVYARDGNIDEALAAAGTGIRVLQALALYAG